MKLIQVEFATPDFDLILDLRNRILRVPLDLKFEIEDIEQEWKQIHLGYFSNDKLVGCLSFVSINDTTLKMRQVAIDDIYQNMGLGSEMIKASEKWCVDHNYKFIEMNAREFAVVFYERLQYSKVGERFEEVSLPHFKMIKKIN